MACRELLDKFQVMDSARETLVIERQTQSAFILKLKFDIEKLSRITADNSMELEIKDRRITELESEIIAKDKDILESDVVKELVEMKDQFAKEIISLKKKYKVSKQIIYYNIMLEAIYWLSNHLSTYLFLYKPITYPS